VLNHDFVDDLLMNREENREVSSRPSCALTSNMTGMQNIIIQFKKVFFSSEEEDEDQQSERRKWEDERSMGMGFADESRLSTFKTPATVVLKDD
jgi:hypothetical protein